MGVFTYTMADFTSPVQATRFFQALSTDSHNLLPQVVPHFIQSIDVHGDPASAGCIKQVNLPAGGPYTYLKNRIDEIDVSKFYIKYTLFEGDVLDDNLECAVYETTYAPSGEGTHLKSIAYYHTKAGHPEPDEAEIIGAKKIYEAMFKAVEDYLIANPQVYA